MYHSDYPALPKSVCSVGVVLLVSLSATQCCWFGVVGVLVSLSVGCQLCVVGVVFCAVGHVHYVVVGITNVVITLLMCQRCSSNVVCF